MSHAHLDAFLHAIHGRDANGLLDHVTNEVTLWSPIFPEPFQGKEKLRAVLSVVLGAIDRFEVVEVMHGNAHSAVAFRLDAGGITLDGMDLFEFDSTGLVATLKVMWRPLPAIVAMQNRIAPLVGAPLMSLVTATAAAA
ncbi:nuclear transport factor 2 family protein [Acidisoma silvae]|uniref:Nuclear transport factor 2 family protein n=1 Tax=Acidisoma silvae TaxID=2802396 RepID=A0A963YVV9_9PROT|nr:nuclear transport factor 2 family protein [Acidisoma silvae]MCB8877886.1 nuclear transport factor 2 family protein [Acidisoma silvae]